ncbi:UNVERIFIED_CONTAM: hypothetical protein Sradi_6108300 [Sesamum radiatum]|uniref:Uncharacterized protein n=1 Tax=Sesamum radiatum TaxID=300843 RepID=A0AAW2KLW0_SESRA
MAVPFATTPSRMKDCILLLSALLSVSLLYFQHLRLNLRPPTASLSAVESPSPLPPPLSLDRVLFSVAASSSSLRSRAAYIRLWHGPISHLNTTFLFLDRPPSYPTPSLLRSSSAQHLVLSPATASPVVKDALALNVPGIYWYVFR